MAYKQNAAGDIIADDAYGSTIAKAGNFGTVKNAQGQALTGVDATGNLTYGSASGGDAASSIYLPTGKIESTPSPYYSRLPSSSLYTADDAANASKALYNTTPFDPAKARSEAIAARQNEISSIDRIYETQRAQEMERITKEGDRDMARTNTISAITGLMGAPEAQSDQGRSSARTESLKKAADDRISAQKASALSAIYGAIDQNVVQEKQARETTIRENSARILGEVAKNAKTALANFSQQGVTWDALRKEDPETFDTLVRQSGEDPFQLYQNYLQNSPNKPSSTQYSWQGKNLIAIEQYPDGKMKTQTFTASQLGIPKGTDFQTVNLGDSVYWYDKESPTNEDGTPKLTRLGAKASAATGSGGISLTNDKKLKLLDANFTEPEIASMEKDIRQYGIEKTIEGMSESQKAAVRKAYQGATADDPFASLGLLDTGTDESTVASGNGDSWWQKLIGMFN